MDLESLSKPEFVIVNGAKRQRLYGDSQMPKVEIVTFDYALGELGLLHPTLVKEFLGYFKANTAGDKNAINRFNSSFTRRIYAGDDIGFEIYNFAEGNIPIVLFDPQRANMAPDSILSEEKPVPNPGYFIATLNENEFNLLQGSALEKTLATHEGRILLRWLNLFESAMRDNFHQLPIETVARNIPESEAKSLLEYYQDMIKNEQRQARDWGKLNGQIVGVEKL